jgi:tRNA 2-selenouridine synthase
LDRIRKKLGGTQYAALKEMLEKWDVAGVARGLIELYYDKLYYKHRPWTPDLEIDLEDFCEGERTLHFFWENRPSA